MRLSRDGLTEISQYGMSDYFRDQLSSLSNDFKTFSFTSNITNGSQGSSQITLSSNASSLELGMQLQFNTGQVVYVASFNSTTGVTNISSALTLSLIHI